MLILNFRSALRFLYIGHLFPSPLVSRYCQLLRSASTAARPVRPPLLSAMSRSAAVLSYSPRGRVQCPICGLHLPSAHIQQHAAVCGLEENEGVGSVGSQPVALTERKRQPPSPQRHRVEAKRKRTAKDRVRSQRQQPMDESEAAEETKADEQKEKHLPPVAFIHSPTPAASQMHTPTSRTVQPILVDSTTTTYTRRRIERADITTHPPSSPVMGYSSDSTPGRGGYRQGGAFQLNINIPSPSPPPMSPVQYWHFSPLVAGLSPAPSWLPYRVAAIPPSIPVTGRSEQTSALSFLTYNVWFDEVHQRTRMTALASLITSLQPDIIALQEVTPPLLSLLQRSAALQQHWVSPHPSNAPYFTLLLSKRQPIAMYRIPFISQMGRDLTALVIDVMAENVDEGQGQVRRLIVSTSHLESLWQSKERRAQQLKQALTTLNSMAAYSHASATASSPSSSASASSVSSQPSSTSLFFMGDTNLRGSECAPLITSQHFTDLYPTLTASHPTNDATGYTYDTVANRMIAAMGRKGSRARYDRVLGRVGEGLEVTAMWRAGMEPIREGVWISDHFGLVTELKLC